jgi:iron complex outermembrane receptor protein
MARAFGYLYALLSTFLTAALPLYLAAFSAVSFGSSNAVLSTPQMEEIIITGLNQRPLLDLPRSATVINSDDIALSAARNITELLAQQANIASKSFSGNSKFTAIDIRGSGDTSVSNVLILIDGIRINAPDLSGADFSILDLSQIKRIEVIRGGNSVRYGSGASHGVVNIFTLDSEKGFKGLIKLDGGSFNAQSQQATLSIADKNQSLTVFGKRSASDGYRVHNTLDSQDLLLNYRVDINHHWSINTKSYIHNDNYELPGGLDRNMLRSGLVDRRDGSIQSGAEGETEDKSQLIKVLFQASNAFNISSTLHYRERKNQFIFGEDFQIIEQSNVDKINQRSLFGEMIAQWHSPNDMAEVTAGYEKNNGDYIRTNGGQQKVDGQRFSGKLNSEAYFLYSTIAADNLSIGAGYRKGQSTHLLEQDKIISNESSPLCDSTTQSTDLAPPFDVITFKSNCPLIISKINHHKNRWKNEAYEANLVYAISASTNLYSSYSKTFRNPNIDELALSPPDLSPQTAKRYEAGIKHAGQRFSIDIGYFHFRTDQEILFRSSTDSFGLNTNSASPMTRRGGELQLSISLNDALEFNGNIGYNDAISDLGARIPLVPFMTAAANLSWQPRPSINSYISIRHTGAREDGNSNLNTISTPAYEKLPSHTVVDTSIRLSQALRTNRNNLSEVSFSFGVKNIFNKKYSDIAYSNTIYPAPTRNIFGSISYAF